MQRSQYARASCWESVQFLLVIIVVYLYPKGGQSLRLPLAVGEVDTSEAVEDTPRPKVGQGVLAPVRGVAGRDDVNLVATVEGRVKQRHGVGVDASRDDVLDLAVGGVADHFVPDQRVVEIERYDGHGLSLL